MPETELRSLSAGLPMYSDARLFLQIMDKASQSTFSQMIESLWEQRGSPQEQEDWTKPEVWIPERLDGAERELALKLWHDSKERLNPRYLHYTWRFAVKYQLLAEHNGKINLTAPGEQFLQEDKNLIAEIDNYEGLIIVLQTVAERGPGRSSQFLEDYTTFCQTYTRYRSDSVIAGALRDRLINLIDRGYIARKGQIYEITDRGLAYLDSITVGGIDDKQAEILRSAKKIKEEARAQLYEYLTTMNPFKFESLIQLLLERMGYENVETTTPTNDKGVDVVADIQLGISRVREVVQAKRYRGNIGRPVLDGLRGSLHRFRAVRGTIITTGGFSKGTEQAAFEVGAAPITLIDGERLLDLLIEYSIGIRKRQVEYFEFDESDLAQLEFKADDGTADSGEQE